MSHHVIISELRTVVSIQTVEAEAELDSTTREETLVEGDVHPIRKTSS